MKNASAGLSHRSAGFSLVEVALALGIVSFALLAIVGLLGVGLSSGKSAQVDTMQTAAARSLLAAIRTNSPSAVSGATSWLNYDGSTNASASGAYFQCTITTNAPPPGVLAANMVGLRLEFQYPLSAAVANRKTNVFHASIVRQN
ncbi:hypothetical protein BH09VER1_BH09VER1_23160 [soil metagenome]